MADLNTITKAELIKDLPAQTSIGATDLYLLQTSVQSFKLQHSDLVANLVDNSTIETNSNKLRIKDNAVGLTKLADINASTTGKVIGKTSGSGDPELIDIDTDLTNVSATHDTLASAKAIKDYVGDKTTGNLVENGWTKFPNGLIIQWGLTEFDGGQNSINTHSFPIQFTTVFQVIVGSVAASASRGSNESQTIAQLLDYTTSSFRWVSDAWDNPNPIKANFLAIGI